MTAIAAIVLSIGISTQEPARVEVKIPGHLSTFWLRKIPAGKLGDADVKSFWIGETEVTWDIYDIYAFRLDQTEQEKATGVDAKSRPSKPYGAPDRGFGHQGYPALGMTANAAQHFCEWLSKKTGKKFRLPTEVEWEYAARAGAKEPGKLDQVAWFFDNGEDQTQPVGKLKPNAWGLYDMLGNVTEWAIGSDKVAITCGGSFVNKADKIGFSARFPFDPKWQEADAHVPKSKWWLSDGPHVGMRLVCDE